MTKKRKLRKFTAFVMAFTALFFCVAMIDISAGECEKALFRCLDDPWWQVSVGGALYCAAGYLFCKKYVEA